MTPLPTSSPDDSAKAEAEGLAPLNVRAIVAEAEAAGFREILSEVMADMLTPESGNPWRLESLKRAAAALTGDSYGFSPGPVMLARLARGTLGGRFRAPYLGDEFETLGRLTADLVAARGTARQARALWQDRAAAEESERIEARRLLKAAESDLKRAEEAHAAEAAALKARGLL